MIVIIINGPDEHVLGHEHLSLQEGLEARRRETEEALQEVHHFRGRCDLCGATLLLTRSWPRDGIIDYGTTEDGLIYTWIRHSGCPVNDAYSWRVYFTGLTTASKEKL